MYNSHPHEYDERNTGRSGFMARVRSSKLFSAWLKLLRILQFLSATISLGLFSSRVWKVIRLYKRLKTSDGAVEGILAAAVVYTIVATILQLSLRAGAPKKIRWSMIVLDVLFVGAFIAVAKMTAPNGPSGPCRKAVGNGIQNPTQYNSASCKLPWGTFVLAIFSTILHALTALFREYHDKQHARTVEKHDYNQPFTNTGH